MASTNYYNAGEDFSDYGSEFSPEEEDILLQLTALHDHQPASLLGNTAIDSVPAQTDTTYDGHGTFITGINDSAAVDANDFVPLPRPPHDSIPEMVSAIIEPGVLPSPVSAQSRVYYPDLSKALDRFARKEDVGKLAENSPAQKPLPQDDGLKDNRSPLQRFRSYPRKPLSVSDLTSGAWCELQYWYTLTRLPGGRRARTPAMKEGSAVHQKLEDQVHTTVKVEILTKEDGFGLRLWNLVQGLRTLRDKGLTREMEVWGLVDGHLVNGVIDSLSHENPNPEFEEELFSQGSKVDPHQSSLTDYFPPKQDAISAGQHKKVYLTDVKTRGSLAPVSPALLRPAKIQLLLYHQMLSEMAACRLDFHKVFSRYGLDEDELFSDTFIAQMSGLHDEVFADVPPDASSVPPSSGTQNLDSVSIEEHLPDFLKYRSLRELVTLVQQEMTMTFPLGDASVGHMLRVEYMHRNDGRTLDSHDFPVSRQALADYLSRYMAWWKGDREAKGVDIEEAFKCRSCDFAADCSWRREIDQARVQAAREKVWANRKKKAIS